MPKFTIGTVYPDVPDERDFNTERLIKDLRMVPVKLPEEYDPPTLIYDQGSTPQCSAYSGAGIKTDEEYAEWGKLLQFDAGRLYAECKKRDGIPNLPGTYPRVVNDVLLKMGVPEIKRSSCPFAFLKPKPEPTPEDWARNKIAAYYRITKSDQDELIKQIVFQFHSISVGSFWYPEWNDAREIFSDPKTPTQDAHAWRIKGWLKKGWKVANSWGKLLWGIAGECIMPFSMFRDIVLPQGDVWKLVDILGEERPAGKIYLPAHICLTPC
jgi:hypothetical protein